MSKYKDLELAALIELLIKHTEEYTRMVSFKVFSVEEFAQCKQQLAEIHSAIQEKSKKAGTPIKNISPNFPDSYLSDKKDPSENSIR